MTPKAEQILEYLHKRFPDMFFAWEEIEWKYGDNTICNLLSSLRTNPDKRIGMRYKDGIANVSFEMVAKDLLSQVVPKLKR